MNRKMIAPVVIAVLLAAYYIGMAVLLLTAAAELNLVVKILVIVVPLILAGYAIWAMVERIKEIKGGEDDDLSQY